SSRMCTCAAHPRASPPSPTRRSSDLIRPAGAAELKVLSGFAMRAPLQEVAREFEAISGHTLVIESAFVGKVAEKVAADDPVDVVIISKPVFDKLADTEKLAGGSGRPLARVPIGLAVKRGASRPDIRTVAGWQKTL